MQKRDRKERPAPEQRGGPTHGTVTKGRREPKSIRGEGEMGRKPLNKLSPYYYIDSLDKGEKEERTQI